MSVYSLGIFLEFFFVMDTLIFNEIRGKHVLTFPVALERERSFTSPHYMD